MVLLRTTGWVGVLAAFGWMGCSDGDFPIGTDALQGSGGADGGSSGDSGGSSGDSGGSAAGGSGGSGAGVGVSATCDAERQALVELIVSNKSCADTADCRTHFVGCGVTEDDCTGAVFTNGDVDEAAVGPLRAELETCALAHEGQRGCGGCERAARAPTCIDGLCIGADNCALEAGVVWDFIARNAACEVDDDCVADFVGGQVSQDGCTSAVYLNRDFDPTALAALRDEYFECEGGGFGSCFRAVPPPACNTGSCGPGVAPNPAGPEPAPVADCGDRAAIISSCTFEATCDVSRCGLPWSGFDQRGCVRPTCTSSDDCGAGERCVAPPLVGDFACEPRFSDDGGHCTLEADDACSCELPASCDPVAYCLPSAFYPEEADCNLGTLDCEGLEFAEDVLGLWLNDERLPEGDTQDALEACRAKIVESRVACEGLAFMSECARNQDGRLSLVELCGESGGVCLQSLAEYLAEIEGECGADWPAISTSKRTGCGVVEVVDHGVGWGTSRVFDAETGVLIGASVGNDVPGGPCNDFQYDYGFVPAEPCEMAEECDLCSPEGDPSALCP